MMTTREPRPAGFAGVGASVDVGAIRNRTVAHVGGQSIIGALNDVSILARITLDRFLRGGVCSRCCRPVGRCLGTKPRRFD